MTEQTGPPGPAGPTGPSGTERTIYLSRVPRAITVAIILVAVSALIGSIGLVNSQRHAQHEAADLRRQIADQRTEATCRASYNNQVSLAIADQNIASGAVSASLADFVIALLKRNQAAITSLQVTLADERKQLEATDVALKDAVDQQRQALANC